ncbi:MAG: hypothetical protein ABIP06_13135 [Pyrinomonadaceae bacterium]
MSLIEFLEERIFNEEILVKKTTLVTAIIGIFTFIIIPAEVYLKDQIPYWYLRFSIYIFLVLFWCLFWSFKRNQLPKTPEGKIGIVMAITTKDEKCKTRLEDDFISEFRKQIKESGLQNLFYVVQTKNYQAERLKPILEEQEVSSDGSPKWIDVQKKNKRSSLHLGNFKRKESRKK